MSEIKKVFDHPVQGKETAKRLLTLCQGTQSLATYTVEFKLLAAESRWNEMALQEAYIQELSDEIKDELAVMDVTDCLEAHISRATKEESWAF